MIEMKGLESKLDIEKVRTRRWGWDSEEERRGGQLIGVSVWLKNSCSGGDYPSKQEG